eukprot:157994-Prorocentrum_lima.AAC.1
MPTCEAERGLRICWMSGAKQVESFGRPGAKAGKHRVSTSNFARSTSSEEATRRGRQLAQQWRYEER